MESVFESNRSRSRGDVMTEVPFDDDSVLGKLLRSVGPFGFIAVDQSCVNMNDLCAPDRPGKIVRCYGNPAECIQVFASQDAETLGCVAGWISDEQHT